MRTAEDIQDDLERNAHGDKEIEGALERLRYLHKTKGLAYSELLRSKFFGTLKYLLVELNDEKGTMLVTDLDTNMTYSFIDARPKKAAFEQPTSRAAIREWAGRYT